MKFLFIKKGSEEEPLELRIGDVLVHANLLHPDEKDSVSTFGGGEYYVNPEAKTLQLFGKSIQFGSPRLEEIRGFKIKIPNGIRFFGKWITFQGWKVTYKDKIGNLTDLTSLIIE